MAHSKNRDKDLLEVMRNASFMLDVGRAIVTAVMSKGGKIAQLRRMLNEQARTACIADIVMADDLTRVGVQWPTTTMELPEMIVSRWTTINYGLTIRGLCTKRNFPGFIDEAVTDATFPMRGGGAFRLKATFVRFARGMTDAEVNAWCDAYGSRRATAFELLEFGVGDPEFLAIHPIVSGQEGLVSGIRCYVVLDRFPMDRGVRLGRAGEAWLQDACFMLFPK